MTPATTQTRMSSSGEPSWVAMRAGFLKMPEPMIEPTPAAIGGEEAQLPAQLERFFPVGDRP